VRRVEDVTQVLWGTRASAGLVSKLNKQIYEKIELWRNRKLEGQFPYVYLDGIVLKRTWPKRCATSRFSSPLASMSRVSERFWAPPKEPKKTGRVELFPEQSEGARPAKNTSDHLR